jgi:chromosome segregation ATPase
MSELDEIRGRVSAVETDVAQLKTTTTQLGELRSSAEAAIALARFADNEVSGTRGALRAHTLALSALRETQLEQGKTLQHLTEAVGALVVGQARHDQALAGHDEAFARHDEAFARHDEAFAEIKGQLTDLTTMVRAIADRG